MDELEIFSQHSLEDLKMRLRRDAVHGATLKTLFGHIDENFYVKENVGFSHQFELCLRKSFISGKYVTTFYGEIIESRPSFGIRGKFKINRIGIFFKFLNFISPVITFIFFTFYFFVTGILVFLWYGPHGNILKLLFCPVLTVILAMMSMFTWSNDVKPRLNTFLDELTNEGQTLNKEDMEAMMAYLKACCEG